MSVEGINIIAVLAATAAMFVVSAMWYMVLFGKVWGKIHDFEKLSKQDQAAAQKQMLPLLGVQLVMTALLAFGLAWAVAHLPEFSPFALAFWSWLVFMFPVLVAATLFGGTPGRWILPKIGVQTGGWLVCALVGVAILGLF